MRPGRIGIGVSAPLSGAAAALGLEMKQAVQLAVEEKNAAGGIAGSRLELDVADDKGSVEAGLDIASDFCSRSEVLGVVGPYNSNVGLAAGERYAAAGLLMITPIVSNPALTERGWQSVFRFTNRDDRTGMAIARHLVDALGKRNAAIVATDTTYGRSMAAEFGKAFAACGGSIVARHAVQEGERDFAGLVASLPTDFDVLFYGGSFEGVAILEALREARLTQLMATGDGCWDVKNFLEPAADLASSGEGVLVLSATPEIGQVDGSRQFAERYAARFGPIGNYAANSFDSACALIAAIEAAVAGDGASRQSVVAAMRGLRLRGIAYPEPTRWDDKGDNQSAVTALHVVEGGRFQQVAVVGQA
jgi:branched-chain amino acid transport system substrate-binding protein